MDRNLCPEGSMIFILNAVNVIFNLISKLPVHTRKFWKHVYNVAIHKWTFFL
jgi:hypothetical protein